MTLSIFRSTSLLCAAAVTTLTLAAPKAQDTARAATESKAVSQARPAWPQWRGPARDGISTESNWSIEGKEKSVWFTNVGRGYSTVSIQDGRLYTIGHDEESEEDTIYCLDSKKGTDIWTYTFKCITLDRAHGGGSLTTPSIDGDLLWVASREGKFFCFEAKTGKLKFQRDFKKEFKLKLPSWGFAASPLVLEEMVVQATGHVFAFDRKGKEIWRTKENYRESYSTPVAATMRGKSVLVCFNGRGLVILDRGTGKELAQRTWKTMYNVNAATPVVVGNKVFISSGYNKGCSMVEWKDDGELALLWESKVMRNHMSGCVEKGGFLYGFDESTFKCIDMEGEVRWQKRGLGKGAFVMAGDRLVILSQRGKLVIAETNSEEFKELASRDVLSGGVCWTTPVILNGRIFARNSLGDLTCLDHRSGE